MLRLILAFVISFIGTAAAAQVSLNSGLMAYYPFNGTFNDASGNGHHGTAMNGVSFGTDQWGNANNAAYFDGVDDWISVAPSAAVTPGHKYSWAFRFKTTSSALQLLFSKSEYTGTGSPNAYQYQIGINAGSVLSSNGLFFATNHFNSCITTNFYTSSYTHGTNTGNNQWYCVVITFDNGVKKVYMNGVLISSVTISGTANNTSIDSCVNGTLRMGVWWQGGPFYFSGQMDEVRLWNRAINAQEIDSVCNLITLAPCDITPGFTYTGASCFTYKMTNTTTASSGAGALSYRWDFGNGDTSTAKDPTYVFPGYGSYTVTLKVTGAGGCTKTITKIIDIPYVRFAEAFGDTITCNGSPATLNALGGVKYSWSPAASLSSPLTAFTKATPEVTTTYTVTVTDSRGCEDADSVVVVITPPPVPVQATPSDTLLCRGDQVRLVASGSVVYQWWPLEDLDNPTSRTPIATVSGSREYVVTGRDSAGCFSTDTVRIAAYLCEQQRQCRYHGPATDDYSLHAGRHRHERMCLHRYGHRLCQR